MKVNLKMTWALFHINAFKSFIKGIIRWKFLIIFFLLILILVVNLGVFLNILEATSVGSIKINDVEAMGIYIHLLLVITIYQYICAILALFILLMWLLVAWLSLIVTRFIVEALFQLFYREDPLFVKQRTRFISVVDKKVRIRMNYFLVLFFALVLFYFIKINVYELSVSEIIKIFILLILTAIPFVWGIGWYGYYRVLKISKHRKSSEKYLFSFAAVQRGFKSTIDALIWLALFGLIILPALFRSIDSVSEYCAKQVSTKYNYTKYFGYLVEKGLPKEGIRIGKYASIPSPDILSNNLSPVGYKLEFSKLRTESKKLQNGFFMVVTFGGLLSVAIPAIGGFFLTRGRKKALLQILFVTLKTAIIAAALQIFISKTYFIDAGDPIGFAAVFMFVLSFFLALESHKDPAL
jgi:hypothetical protein